MKKSILIISLFAFIGCEKATIIPESSYDCSLSYPDNSDEHPKKEKFEAKLKEVLQIFPGMQVAVRSKDGNMWMGAQGMADIPNEIPFENCTKTMVGSISKIHTAVMIMQMHEEGLLSIEDPIKKWIDADLVKEIENGDVITIRQLLMHTSGIKDYLGTKHHINAVNIPNLKLSPKEKLAYIFGKSADFTPGAKYGYSNSNYVLLGLIIEKLREMPLHIAEQTYITALLGLFNTEVGTIENPIPSGTARPYLAYTDGEEFIDVMQFAVSDGATGDGGVATNMQESLLFIEGIFNHLLVSEETVDLMCNERVNENDKSLFSDETWYGLGLEQYESKHGYAYGHTGSTSAYWSFLVHFPDSGVTLSVASNSTTKDDAKTKKALVMIRDLVDILFE